MAQSRRVDVGIVQRGKSYTFTVAMGRDSQGKQIRKTMTYTPPDKLTVKRADKVAKEEYQKFKGECFRIREIGETIQIGQLCDEYFRNHALKNMNRMDIFRCKDVIRDIKKTLGKKKVQDVSLDILLKQYEDRGKREIVNDLAKYTTLRGYCFGTQQEETKATSSKKKNLTSLSKAEISRLLPLLHGNILTIIKLWLLTGINSDEAAGLRWEDIDFDNKQIHVKMILSAKIQAELLPVKYPRDVKMNSEVYDLLKDQEEKHRVLREKIGDSCPHPEMVFISFKGNYLIRNERTKSLRLSTQGTEFESRIKL